MAVMLSKGDSACYISRDGVMNCRVKGAVVFMDRVLYLLENGDYAADTPYGLVKTYPDTQVIRAFMENRK